MGWVFSFALLVTWLIGHDPQVLIASAILRQCSMSEALYISPASWWNTLYIGNDCMCPKPRSLSNCCQKIWFLITDFWFLITDFYFLIRLPVFQTVCRMAFSGEKVVFINFNMSYDCLCQRCGIDCRLEGSYYDLCTIAIKTFPYKNCSLSLGTLFPSKNSFGEYRSEKCT